MVKHFQTRRFGTIVLPTGAGKSYIIALAGYFLQTRNMLLVTPRTDIREQIVKDLRSCNILEDPKLAPHVEQITASKTLHHQTNRSDVVVSNAQMFAKDDSAAWKEFLQPDAFGLVVVDEAHHFPASLWRRIRDYFHDHAFVLFLTATPMRSDGQRVCSLDDIIEYMTRDEAVQRGIIRHSEQIVISVGEKMQNLIDTNETDKALWCAYYMILKTLVQTLTKKNKEFPLPGGLQHRALLRVNRADEANVVLKICQKYFPGLNARLYDGTHKKQSLKSIRAAFEAKAGSNRPQLLIIQEMLGEGYDHPPISIVAVASRMGSGLKFEQFVGRSVRKVRCKKTGEIESKNTPATVIQHAYFKNDKVWKLYENGYFGQVPQQDEEKKINPVSEAPDSFSDESVDIKVSHASPEPELALLAARYEHLLTRCGGDHSKALDLFFARSVQSSDASSLDQTLELVGKIAVDAGGEGECQYLSVARMFAENKDSGLPGDSRAIKERALSRLSNLPQQIITDVYAAGIALDSHVPCNIDFQQHDWREHWRQYIYRVYGPQEKWGSHFTLQAIADEYQVEFIVVSAGGPGHMRTISPLSGGSQFSFYLAYTGAHYMATQDKPSVVEMDLD